MNMSQRMLEFWIAIMAIVMITLTVLTVMQHDSDIEKENISFREMCSRDHGVIMTDRHGRFSGCILKSDKSSN